MCVCVCVCVGVERENGIDELGYLSSEELLAEVGSSHRQPCPPYPLPTLPLYATPLHATPHMPRAPLPTRRAQVLSWRLMIVPVLRTTGVNTKILVALELGVPLVITPVAASPFDIPENETVVAFADQALDFVQQTVSVYTVSWLWTRLARASRQHWENLATHDPARSDVRTMLATICFDTTTTHYLSSWTPHLIDDEPPTPMLNLPKPPCPAGDTNASAAAANCPRPRPLGTCLQGGNWSSVKAPPLLLVGSHAMEKVFPGFDLLHQVRPISPDLPTSPNTSPHLPTPPNTSPDHHPWTASLHLVLALLVEYHRRSGRASASTVLSAARSAVQVSRTRCTRSTCSSTRTGRYR